MHNKSLRNLKGIENLLTLPHIPKPNKGCLRPSGYPKVRIFDAEWDAQPHKDPIYSPKSGITFKSGETYLLCHDSIGDEKKHKDATPNYIFPTNGSTIEMLEFVLRKGRHSVCFSYNIDAEISAILRQWIIEQYRKLNNGKTPTAKQRWKFIESLKEEHTYRYKNKIGKWQKRKWTGFVITDPNTGKKYNISFIKGIYFKVASKYNVTIFDLTNWYKRMSLAANAEKSCKRENVFDFVKQKVEFDHKHPWKYTREEILEYAQADCNFAQELAEILIKAIKDSFGFIPKKLNRISTLAKQVMLLTIPLEFLKPLCFISDETQLETALNMQEYSIRCFKGGLFFTTIQGLMNIVALDINSAYASIVRNLVDMKHGKYQYVIGKYSSDTMYGKYRCYHKFDGMFQWRTTKHHEMLMPVTEELYEDYLTKSEIVFMEDNYYCKTEDCPNRFKGYEFHDKQEHPCSLCGKDMYHWKPVRDYIIIDGYEFVHSDEPCSYPFRELVDDMFKRKAQAKSDPSKGPDSMEYRLFKGIPNCLYGILAENINGVGILSNFVYASEITARTRLIMRKQCLRFGIDPLKVPEYATDAMFLRPEQIPEWFEASDELGEFSQDEDKSVPLVLINSGFSLAGSTEDGYTIGEPVRYRGLPYTDTKSKTYKKFTLNPLEALFEKERPLKIFEALIQDCPEDIGIFDKAHGTKKICYTSNRRKFHKHKKLVSFTYNPVTLDDLLPIATDLGEYGNLFYQQPEIIESLPLNDLDLKSRGEPLPRLAICKEFHPVLDEKSKLLAIDYIIQKGDTILFGSTDSSDIWDVPASEIYGEDFEQNETHNPQLSPVSSTSDPHKAPSLRAIEIFPEVTV